MCKLILKYSGSSPVCWRSHPRQAQARLAGREEKKLVELSAVVLAPKLLKTVLDIGAMLASHPGNGPYTACLSIRRALWGTPDEEGEAQKGAGQSPSHSHAELGPLDWCTWCHPRFTVGDVMPGTQGHTQEMRGEKRWERQAVGPWHPTQRVPGLQGTGSGGSDLVQFPFWISLKTLVPDTPRTPGPCLWIG